MSGDTISVLIIDSDATIRKILKALLDQEPAFTVAGMAATGEEGIQLAADIGPDAVIVDANLSDQDTFEVVQTILAGGRRVAILVVSASGEVDTMREAMRAGACDFLTKPLDPDELLEALRRCVEMVFARGEDAPLASAPSVGAAAPAPEPVDRMGGALDLEESDYADAGVVEEEKAADDLSARKSFSWQELQEKKEAEGHTRGISPPAPRAQPKMRRSRERAEDIDAEEAFEEEMEEAAPEPAPPPAPAAPASVDIDGDVHGDVMVAGGDVIVVNNRAEALKYENQARRFDAAFPDKVEHKKTATLWVGVTKPDAPPPFEGVPADVVTPGPEVDIPLPVDPVSGDLQEVHLDVQVRAPQYEPSKDSATLTVRPDGSSDKVRFLLEAQDEGKGMILVQFYLDKKRLGEIELTSVVEKARAGEKFTFKLQVATLYLAFGVG